MLRLGLVGCTVTPPSVFGSDGVTGGGVVDGGGADAAGLQACGAALDGCALADRVDDNALGVDKPVVGDGVSDGGVDGVGGGAMVEP